MARYYRYFSWFPKVNAVLLFHPFIMHDGANRISGLMFHNIEILFSSVITKAWKNSNFHFKFPWDVGSSGETRIEFANCSTRNSLPITNINYAKDCMENAIVIVALQIC
jgi:hypothetical protein